MDAGVFCGVYVCVCVRLLPSRYFFLNGKGSVDAHQGGVFRVNCMDSLDRTNVVQSMLARRMLQKQLLVRPRLPVHIKYQCAPPTLHTTTPHLAPLFPHLQPTHTLHFLTVY